MSYNLKTFFDGAGTGDLDDAMTIELKMLTPSAVLVPIQIVLA
ncbi:hypothetical protein [Bradyrhizobium jicamae]|nr:hypothetical protein [Bradyrhizobium jicamae]